MEIYYRCKERMFAPSVDEFGYAVGEGSVDVVIEHWPVLKRTQKGAWVGNEYEKHFVLDAARKQFASPSKELAIESFKSRKKRQISILTAQIRSVEKALGLLKWKEPLDITWMVNNYVEDET